jgi:hypothetical protein
MNLDMPRKAALIQEVDALVDRVRQQVHSSEEARKILDMTSFALTYLQCHTPDALRALLDVPHATTTVQDYWQDFADYLRPTLEHLEGAYPEPEVRQEALLYFLGWLHRVRRGPAGDSRRSLQTVRGTETQISRPEKPQRGVEYRPQNRPTVSGEPSTKIGNLLNQPATPSRTATPTYKQGDRVQVTVVTAGFSGVVRLPDGTEIRGVNLFGVKAGATITVRIVDVTRDGRVRRVVR